MPIRDIVLTVVVVALLPVCVARPWIGVLVWSWLGYMNPHRLTWSFAFSIHFAEMVAIATFIGMLLGTDDERRPLPWFRETRLLAALWGIYTLTTLAAFYPDDAWPQWSKVSKVLVFTFIPLLYFQNRERLRYLFLVVAMSIGFYGLKGGIFSLRSGGIHNVMGPEGTFIGGNVEIGLALNMMLPFLLYLAREEPRRWLRGLLLAMFVFSIVAVIFTYSRGAILGLPVVLMMLFLRARRRLVGIVAFCVLAYFVTSYAPEQWFGRMETIQTYEQDRSAMMRLDSWYVAWRFALDHPLMGGGFWVLPNDEVFERYLAEFVRSQSAHSIYLTVLADHGFPGLAVFIGLIVSCFASLFALRRKLARRPDGAQLAGYCQMIEASLIVYLVSGAFVSQAYWDLFYALVAFVILLRAIARREGVAARRARAKAVTPRAHVPALAR